MLLIFIIKGAIQMEENTITEAKKFIELQRKLNKDNIKRLKNMGYDTTELKSWDRIYKNISKVLNNVEE